MMRKRGLSVAWAAGGAVSKLQRTARGAGKPGRQAWAGGEAAQNSDSVPRIVLCSIRLCYTLSSPNRMRCPNSAIVRIRSLWQFASASNVQLHCVNLKPDRGAGRQGAAGNSLGQNLRACWPHIAEVFCGAPASATPPNSHCPSQPAHKNFDPSFRV
jgi:hypothetical protein